MAYFFTLLFVLTAYVTPQVLFGQLALFRIEVAIALVAVFTALPNFVRSGIFKVPQTYACIALGLAIAGSVSTNGWIGGGIYATYSYLVVAFGFFLAGANFSRPWHFKVTVLTMVLGSAFFIANGLHDLYLQVIPSNYLYGDGELRRLRGLGFVYDPNDFAQVLVSLVPLVFLWKTKNRAANLFLLGLPVALLITGMYFTHSRGSAIALMAVIMFTFRRKIGTVPAVVLAGGLFAASLALGWSGGRDVSMEAGADRLDAWSTGLELIKAHPLTGVGFGQFADFNDITAHNSIIVCAAENGLPGFVCWIFFVFAAVRTGLRLSAPAVEQAEETTNKSTDMPKAGVVRLPGSAIPRTAAVKRPFVMPAFRSSLPAAGPAFVDLPVTTRPGLFARTSPEPVVEEADPADAEEIRGMARLLVASLTGFLTAGWFLSRAISIWLFLYCGMMFALTRMAKDRGMRPRFDSLGLLVKWSAIISVGLLLLVYVTLRVRKVTGH